MKSNSDQRSPARFSTGVPVNARRAVAFRRLTARAWRVSAFLIACASSRIASRHAMRSSHAVRAAMPYVVITRSTPLSPAAGSASHRLRRSGSALPEGCTINRRSDGAKRRASSRQFASNEAGATSSEGPSACSCLSQSSSASV